ncbi:MAG: hypothetical protein WCE51_02895 [Chthoniobacterales bacterium]|jgi:hypothetical protein
MKNMRFVVRSVLVAAFVATSLAIIAGCATQSGPKPVANTDAGRLVIKRNFSMGGLAAVLWDNGVKVATIAYNRTYDAPIAVGPHSLKLTRVPPGFSDVSVETRLVVQKGQTYTLVADMNGPQIRLLQ